MKFILLTIIIITLAGCYQRPVFTKFQPEWDEVWSSYHFHGPMPRAYEKNAFGRWVSTGRVVTKADIEAAPCKVIVGHYPTSYFAFYENTIYLDVFAKVTVLWHESQHCVDWRNGIKDPRELELRGMIAEMGGIP